MVTKGELIQENTRLRAELERLNAIVRGQIERESKLRAGTCDASGFDDAVALLVEVAEFLTPCNNQHCKSEKCRVGAKVKAFLNGKV